MSTYFSYDYAVDSSLSSGLATYTATTNSYVNNTGKHLFITARAARIVNDGGTGNNVYSNFQLHLSSSGSMPAKNYIFYSGTVYQLDSQTLQSVVTFILQPGQSFYVSSSYGSTAGSGTSLSVIFFGYSISN